MHGSFWWLVSLNLFDAWATLRGLGTGVVEEVNPLFTRLLALSPSCAGFVKLGAVPFLACLAATAPAGSWADRALWALVGVYGAVALLHLLYLGALA